MRKNKTYEQQKKFYDESNCHESLGAIFLYWLECGSTNVKDIQATYREGNRECKEYLLDDLRHLCKDDIKTYHQLVKIFLFGHK